MSEQQPTGSTVEQPPTPDSLDAGLAVAFGPDPEPPPNLPARYRFIRWIDCKSGMGDVLQARDTLLGRDIAIKVLKKEKYKDRPDLVRRFIREAKIGSQLQHPGIAPIHEMGYFPDGRPYLAMKLILGERLDEKLKARTTPQQDLPHFVKVFEQVCQPLAYAHARGIIHRDLKPSNIMVGQFEEVQVMDWGLVKVLSNGREADNHQEDGEPQPPSESESITSYPEQETLDEVATKGLLGTLPYMAPEQARCEVDRVDERADVFGLGAVLCKILTGEPPYVAPTLADIQRMAAMAELDDAFARLDDCGADPELIRLAKRCLAKEPADRPRDAGKLAEEVKAYRESVEARLEQAKIDRAAQEARAEEARATAEQERKAREGAQALAVAQGRLVRRTFVLAATVVLAVLLGSAAGGYELWQYADRQAQITRDTRDAVSRATPLLTEAKALQPQHLEQAAVLLTRAREHAQQAEKLGPNGMADQALSMQVRQLRDELAEVEKDQKLLTDLDKAWFTKPAIDVREEWFNGKRVVELVREALRAYGLPAGAGDAKEVAARIRERPRHVTDALVVALDEWIALAESPNQQVDQEHLDWLRAAVAEADPDEWRQQVRMASAEKNRAKRKTMLKGLADKAVRELVDKPGVRPQPPRPLTRLANVLLGIGEVNSAVRLLQAAQQHYDRDFWVNHDLGQALLKTEPPRAAEAVDCLRVAVALNDKSAGAYVNLGNALCEWGNKLPDAVAAYDKAIKRKPDFATAYYNLGVALFRLGKLDDAIHAYRRAIELKPNFAEAYYNLGLVFRQKGLLADALANLVEGHKLGSSVPSWKYPSAQLVKEVERLIQLEAKLPAILFASAAIDKGEQIEYALLFYYKGHYRASCRLYAEAFGRDPRLAEDLKAERRYMAACAAAKAGSGKGADAAKLDDQGRARWRKQALDWLRADFLLWTKHLGTPSRKARPDVRHAMQHWRRDLDLVSLRWPPALAKLPPDEQRACNQLWANVAELLRKASSNP